MRWPVRVALVVLFCCGVAACAVFLVLSAIDPEKQTVHRSRRSSSSPRGAGDSASRSAPLEDEDTQRKSDAIFLDRDKIEDGGFGMAASYTGSIQDHRSLRELREAIQARGRVGLATLRAECDRLRIGSQTPGEELAQAGRLFYELGLIEMYEGLFPEATTSFQRSLEIGSSARIPSKVRADLMALLGIVALRRGEVDNCIACVGPSSCIFPIAHEAVHTQQAGSRDAVRQFTAYLDQWPGDLRIRWLLNIAYMTLGEYPEKVPPKYLIPLDTFRSKLDVGRFDNVALRVGLTAGGQTWPAGASSTTSRATGCPTSSRPRSTPTGERPCSSTGVTAHSRTGPPPPALATSVCPECRPRRLRQRRQPRRAAAARGAGSSRCGSRC